MAGEGLGARDMSMYSTIWFVIQLSDMGSHKLGQLPMRDFLRLDQRVSIRRGEVIEGKKAVTVRWLSKDKDSSVLPAP